ncbi:MAG: hypothetical protein U0P45_07690 [Acidimicrobiales bacterium]
MAITASSSKVASRRGEPRVGAAAEGGAEEPVLRGAGRLVGQERHGAAGAVAGVEVQDQGSLHAGQVVGGDPFHDRVGRLGAVAAVVQAVGVAVLADRDGVAHPGQPARLDQRGRVDQQRVQRRQLGRVRAGQGVDLVVGVVVLGGHVAAAPVPVEVDVVLVLAAPPRHAPWVDGVHHHDGHVVGQGAGVEAAEQAHLDRRGHEPLHPVHAAQDGEGPARPLGAGVDHVHRELLAVRAGRLDRMSLDRQPGAGRGPAEAGPALAVGERQGGHGAGGT